MRTHTQLTRGQVALNALIAAAPAAVVTASHLDTVSDRRDYLRGCSQSDRGDFTLQEAEARARVINNSRYALQSEPVDVERPSTPQQRLTAIRRSQAIAAAKSALRTGARPEFVVRVAADGEQPSYTVERDRRWLGNDTWGTDFWIHRILLPACWMTLVRQVGYHDGTLLDGRFVLDCLAVTPGGMAGGSNVYEVVAVRNGRGNEVVVETIFVRTWATGHETYYADVRRALRAKPPAKVLEVMAELDAERVAALPSDEDLEAMAMLAEEAA